MSNDLTLDKWVEEVVDQFIRLKRGMPKEIFLNCADVPEEFSELYMYKLKDELKRNDLDIPVSYGNPNSGHIIDLNYYYAKCGNKNVD